MNIRILQHAPYEGPAYISQWAAAKGHEVRTTKLFNCEGLPDTADFDFLIIMGGPMGVHDIGTYAWMNEEQRFIEQAIKDDKRVLGICLGAQLIAHVLGGRVYKNTYPERGWHTISLLPEAKESVSLSALSDEFTAFLWHGDAFDVPSGARRLAKSQACENQAFEYDGRVVGLQFHLEATPDSIEELMANSLDSQGDRTHIQPNGEILAQAGHTERINRLMDSMLDNLADLSSRGGLEAWRPGGLSLS